MKSDILTESEKTDVSDELLMCVDLYLSNINTQRLDGLDIVWKKRHHNVIQSTVQKRLPF